MDAVLPSRRSLALQTQIPLTDAGPTPTGAWTAPTVTKIAIKGATRLSNLKDLNYIYKHARHSKKDIEKGFYQASQNRNRRWQDGESS